MIPQRPEKPRIYPGSITTLVRSIGDIDRGLQNALYAHAAYPDGPIIANASRKVTPLVQGQFRAIVIEDDRTLTISVAGTDSIANAIVDAECLQVSLLKGIEGAAKILCHYGFWKGMDALWPRLLPFLITNRKCLTLTGHSLGAAIARLLLLRMYLELHLRPSAIITFGEPRSLNWYGAMFCQHEIAVHSVRWIDQLDVVTRVPWVTLWPPHDIRLFRHVDGSYWIVDGKIEVNRPTWKRLPQDWHGYWSERRAKGQDREMFPLIEDHSIARYRDRISEIALPPAA
jgi:hypothetical protein